MTSFQTKPATTAARTPTTQDGLVVVETHPVQYHAPVYRVAAQQFGVPLTVIYGSDFSVAGYKDREFGESFAWDGDLLSGYESTFVQNVASGGASSYEDVTGNALAERIAALRPGTLLLTGYANSFYRAAIWHAARSQYNVIFRGEATDHAISRNLIKSSVRDLSLRWLYRRCRSLLCIGQRAKKHYLRLGVAKEKLVFSPYCVDTGSFSTGENNRLSLRAPARRELAIADTQRMILFSGKLTQRKGPDILIDAIKKSHREQREETVVVFLGAGAMRDELQALANSEPAVSVRFPGFRNQHQLSPFYHAADLFVLPSLYSETWGLVVNEALAHGVPCIVSEAVGCAADLIKPGVTGEVARTGDSQSLSDAIRKLIPLTGRAEIRASCRELVDRYSVRAAAEGIAKAYFQLHP